MTCMIRNPGTVPMTVETGLIKILNPLQDPNSTITQVGADVSFIPGFGQSFRMITPMRKQIIEPGDQISFSAKIPFTVINNITQWNAEYGKTALMWSVTNHTAGTLDHYNARSHNLTFVADAI